jgi:hypothetical protein
VRQYEEYLIIVRLYCTDAPYNLDILALLNQTMNKRNYFSSSLFLRAFARQLLQVGGAAQRTGSTLREINSYFQSATPIFFYLEVP